MQSLFLAFVGNDLEGVQASAWLWLLPLLRHLEIDSPIGIGGIVLSGSKSLPHGLRLRAAQ
jgi:hypothetical protein